MLRAMVEGLNYQFVQIVGGFESSLDMNAEKIVAIGGPSQNALWMQNKADVLGKPVKTR